MHMAVYFWRHDFSPPMELIGTRKEFNSKPSSTLLNSPLVEAAGSSLCVTICSHPQEQPEFEVILRDILYIFYT